MGYKDICLTCRKAFNRGTDFTNPLLVSCPECGTTTIAVSHKFKPPRKLDSRKWEVVELLLNNGFLYEQISEEIEPGVYKSLGSYPENMREAKEFIHKFRQKK
jgi:DNA-directed RNA polymerase subunit RPC12/RpoP